MHANSCIYMHIHAYTCIYMHIHAYTCVYIHIHADTCIHAVYTPNDAALSHQVVKAANRHTGSQILPTQLAGPTGWTQWVAPDLLGLWEAPQDWSTEIHVNLKATRPAVGGHES